MNKKWSIPLKFFAVFTLTMLLIAGAFIASLSALQTYTARHEAGAVADQVIAFRTWVAQTGMVWVRKLVSGYHDFLDQENAVDGGVFYGKNPALATRELSMIANKEATRAFFRVTSDDYRHEDNIPDDFELSAVRAFKENHLLEFVEQHENGTYRYARPILVQKECLKCHGDPEDAPPAVIEKYGSQKAFGYKVGEVRGIVSVTLPAMGIQEVLQSLITPWTVFFIFVIFVINLLFIQSVVVRLVRLTRSAEAIAAGKLETELVYTNPSESNDELDHLYHATNLLKRSLIILFKRLDQQAELKKRQKNSD
ncbi:c-type heme family protein [Candidatus Electrothrix sp.]|uniref:c-type heme family protein n=1 Tax=Candidatus Electrothrix sp. TaxID=2170559 RepID=UPI0040569FD3